MSDIERQLTDFRFISDELDEMVENDTALLLSVMESHKHGESFGLDEATAKAVIARVNEIQNSDVKKNLIKTTLALESLRHVIPALLAENNKRLLVLIR